MEKTFKYKFSVKGYELDSFGHVNNAVYLNYLEQARWEILNETNLLDLIKVERAFLVVVETNIKYIKELKLFDEAVVETRMYRHGFFLEFRHNIIGNNKEKISKALVKCLFVDKNRLPSDIPEDILPYTIEK